MSAPSQKGFFGFTISSTEEEMKMNKLLWTVGMFAALAFLNSSYAQTAGRMQIFTTGYRGPVGNGVEEYYAAIIDHEKKVRNACVVTTPTISSDCRSYRYDTFLQGTNISSVLFMQPPDQSPPPQARGFYGKQTKARELSKFVSFGCS
jgi:hypothetical protein